MPPAVTDAYGTAAGYRSIFGLQDGSKDAQILVDLTATSRVLERTTGQFFTRDAAATTRIVYPRGYKQGDPEAENPWRGVKTGRVLDLPAPLSAVPTSIVVDINRLGSFVGLAALVNPGSDGATSGDYQCWPLNANTGPEPKPWTQLYIPTWTTAPFGAGWPPGSMVQVTAFWGWPAIPSAIVDACYQLTGILRLDSPRATQRIPEASASAFAANPAAKEILDSLQLAYKKSGELFA